MNWHQRLSIKSLQINWAASSETVFFKIHGPDPKLLKFNFLIPSDKRDPAS